MKSPLKNLLLIGITLITLVACKSTNPQVKLEQIKEMDEKVQNIRYTFDATTANPMGGKVIHLSGGYYLKVTPDTISAYLPYYGRAYAGVDLSEGGIKFVSTKFDYNVSDKQKGVSNVSIKIKDNSQNYKLSLMLGETGRATLYVIQNNRQSISFAGDIH